MTCTSLFTFDTIGCAYNFLAHCEDENPIGWGVDNLPAYPVLRYGVYRQRTPAVESGLGDRTVTYLDEMVADIDEDEWDELGWDDDFGVDVVDDAPVEGAVSSFRGAEVEITPRVINPRRRVVEIPARVPEPNAARAELIESMAGAPAADEKLPTRIGLRRAHRVAAR